MADRKLKTKITTPGDASGTRAATEVQETGGTPAAEAAQKTRELGAETSALQQSLRELTREFQLVGLAVRAVIDPLAARLQASLDLLDGLKVKLEALHQTAAGPADKGAERTHQPEVLGPRLSDSPAGPVADEPQTSPAESSSDGPRSFSEPARQIDAAWQREETDQAALLKAWLEYSSASSSNTQKLIDQVRAAVAQQQQFQSQIDALKSAQQQQAGQNANRNLNTGN